MSDTSRQPDSAKSREELLDEIYLLRDVAGEREQYAVGLQAVVAAKDKALVAKDADLAERNETIARSHDAIAVRDRAIADLRAQLDLILRSRSWRWAGLLRRMLHPHQPELALPPDVAPYRAAALSPHEAASAAVAQVDRSTPLSGGTARPEPIEDRAAGVARLYVDVTELVLHHGRTGVQRVTREILRALVAAPPAGYRVVAVCADRDGAYRSVSITTIDHPDNAGAAATSADVRADAGMTVAGPTDDADCASGRVLQSKRGDVFLNLDHSMTAAIGNAERLGAMRANGVRVWFVCHDLLPLQHPEWFPPDVPPKFRKWIEVVARNADGVACVSAATEAALRAHLATLGLVREPPPVIGHFHLGADMSAGAGDKRILTAAQAELVERIRGTTSFLMVGTLEPRKGHAQALAAFNQLWAAGENITLVIVGPPGWMTEVTQRRIRHHDEYGKRLFWFMDADDALLDALYGACSALLAASEGEGFGLPLVEAAQHGLPILCRDLPVFREVCGIGATYFTGDSAEAVVQAIVSWRRARPDSGGTTTCAMSCVGWSDSAQQLARLVLRRRADAEPVGSGGPPG